MFAHISSAPNVSLRIPKEGGNRTTKKVQKLLFGCALRILSGPEYSVLHVRLDRLVTNRFFQTPQATFRNGWLNESSFVEVTLCHVGLSEIPSNR